MESNFNPLVSIIIPVYNGSNYIRQAINSALAQTYKNIEIIVVNDGSKDNTEEIVKSYGDKVRYFRKENGGVATALNLAIKKSKGEYISWLSHDDLYYPNKIKKQIELLSEKSDDDRKKIILMSNYALIDEKSRITATTHFEKNHSRCNLEYPLYGLLNGLVNGLTLLIPKNCFEEFGYFDPALRATQDYALWFKIFPKCKIIFMTDLLAKTRMHGGQVTNKPSTYLENDTLWTDMIKNMSKEQKIAVGGSVIGFYQKVYEVVKDAKFVGVEKYLLRLINKYKNRDVSQIKISVIIPFYNGIKDLSATINSVSRQTHKNLEIILINDGSTEDTKKIVNAVKKDKRIIYYNNKIRHGLAESRNFGIQKSTGEFIAFLNSGDLFLLDKIEKQLSFMLSNLYVFSHTSYEIFDLSDGSSKKRNLGKINYAYPSTISNCPIVTSTVMVHRDLFVNEKNVFPKFDREMDVCLWIILSRQSVLYGLNIVLTKIQKCNTLFTESNVEKMKNLKVVFDYVFENGLDERSVSEFGKLNNLLLWHVGKIYIPLHRGKISMRQKEKMILDKIYLYPVVGHVAVRVYLRAKKILGIYEK